MGISTVRSSYPQANIGRIPLWTERDWDQAALMRRRADIGSRQFDRGYRQRAYTDEDRTFPSFLKCKKPIKVADIRKDNWPCYSGVDLSSETRPGTVMFTLTRSPEGTKIPVEIRRGSWKGPDIIRQMFEVERIWRPVIMNVENNALQDIVIQWALEKQHDLPIRGFHTGHQKANPVEGLAGIEVEMENGSWIIPAKEYEGHALNCQCPWCVWDNEMQNYPQSATSDCVMACWFAREAARDDITPGLFFVGGN